MLLLPMLAGCSGLEQVDQGALQPQATHGPCQVRKFYSLTQTDVHTDMAVGGGGNACSFVMFNPDLQLTLTAALITGQPSHGRASAGLLTAGRQATVSYVSQPGYTGSDRFTVTVEPDDRTVTVHVIVVNGTAFSHRTSLASAGP